MINQILKLIIVITAGSTALPAIASTSNSKNASDSNTGSQAQNRTAEPPGFVLVEEDVSIDMNRLPTLFMADARSEFINKNFGEAAADLKAAGRVFSSEAKQRKSNDAGAMLTKAQDQLSQLEQDVRATKIIDQKSLDQRLAQIMYLKAESDRQLALSHWTRNEYKSVGYNLTVAADEIDQAAKWSGQQLDKAAQKTIQDVRRVGGKLAEGSKWTSLEVRTALSDFSTAVRKIEQNLNSQGTSSATTQSDTSSKDSSSNTSSDMKGSDKTNSNQ
jgi:hypothetical protein